MDEIEAASGRTDGMIGVPTGFADLDELTNGLHPGQMIVIAARPAVGKSTLGLDIARSAAIKHNMASGGVLARDEPQRDHHAPAVRRGHASSSRTCARALKNQEQWTKLAADHGRDHRRPAVHRRQPEHVADGDPGQVPPAQAAARPASSSSSTTCS